MTNGALAARARRTAIVLAGLASLAAPCARAQAPGDGWALAFAPPREIRHLYWDLFQTTELWVRLEPIDPEGKPPLVHLIFQAFFAGRETKQPPSRTVVRAQPFPLTVVRDLTLRFAFGGEALDLTGPGARYRLLYPVCGPEESCAANAVEAEIGFPELRAIAAAPSVRGEALGFPIALTGEDKDALAHFLARVGPPAAERGPIGAQ
jgi:hypothetical protein